MTNVNVDQGRNSFTLVLNPSLNYVSTGYFNPPLTGVNEFRILGSVNVNLVCSFVKPSFIYDGATNTLSRTQLAPVKRDVWYRANDTQIATYTVSLDNSTPLNNGEVVNIVVETR